MARNFDGVNDYLDAGNPSALDLAGDEVTLSARVRLDTVDGEGKILAKWADSGSRFQYLLSIDNNEKCLAAIYNGATQIALGTTTLVAGVWYHLALTYDGSAVKVYCNGVEEDSTSTSGNMSSTTAPVRIGAGSGGSGTEEPFDGDIGHCAIWDKGLSAGEIKSLFNGVSPLNIRPSNLLFYPPVNGQNPEYDVVGGLDLTVNGTTVVEEPPIPHSIKAP